MTQMPPDYAHGVVLTLFMHDVFNDSKLKGEVNQRASLGQVEALQELSLLFSDFHCPKVEVNMPFICSKYFKKEQTNNNFYDENMLIAMEYAYCKKICLLQWLSVHSILLKVCILGN